MAERTAFFDLTFVFSCFSSLTEVSNRNSHRLWTQSSADITGYLTCTVDVIYTCKCRGPPILNIIHAIEMKLCVYNAYVL